MLFRVQVLCGLFLTLCSPSCVSLGKSELVNSTRVPCVVCAAEWGRSQDTPGCVRQHSRRRIHDQYDRLPAAGDPCIITAMCSLACRLSLLPPIALVLRSSWSFVCFLLLYAIMLVLASRRCVWASHANSPLRLLLLLLSLVQMEKLWLFDHLNAAHKLTGFLNGFEEIPHAFPPSFKFERVEENRVDPLLRNAALASSASLASSPASSPAAAAAAAASSSSSSASPSFSSPPSSSSASSSSPSPASSLLPPSLCYDHSHCPAWSDRSVRSL